MAEYELWGTQDWDVNKAESLALHAEDILCTFLNSI